ncbi:MAG: tetratricopeptide repeat protein [Desulfovibrio sp.]
MYIKRFRPLVRLFPHPLVIGFALLQVAFGLLAGTGSAAAATVAFRTGADTDVLTFALDAPPVSNAVRRVAPRALLVRLPAGESLASSREFPGARLVEAVRPGEGGVRVEMKTNAFGYIFTPVPGGNNLQIQFFRDPIGARWTDPAAEDIPTTPQPEPVPPPQPPAATTPRPAADQPSAAPSVASDAAPPEPAANGPLPIAGSDAVEAPSTPSGPNGLALDAPRSNGNSLFAVPYAVRVPVSGLENQLQIEPSDVGTLDLESGTARYKAVKDMVQPVSPKKVLPAADTETRPTSREQEVPAGAETTSPAPVSAPVVDGFIHRQTAPYVSLQPDAPAPPVSPVPPAAAGTEPPEQKAPVSSLAAEAQQAMQEAQAAYDGQQTGEEVVQETKAPAAPTGQAPEPEVSQQVTAETAAQERPERVTVDDVAVQQSIDAIESENAQAAADAKQRALSPEQAQRVAELQLQLLKAQSHVASGKLAEARDELQSILAAPEITPELRLEAMYSLGGVLMALYRDNPAAHFEEITSLYKEAMNADTRSPNIPQALLNLGLVNLRVGNLPEARAYFELLMSQYPDNENVAAIEYYWGEYHYRQGNWQEAADRFQGFIEQYPEQERLAREAAFRLAESLKNLGLYEQAYQIVDYIDKRWPQVFESNPEFLKLAGDVEFHLDKLDPAKEHYWTYFNINPKADEADIVLARIGDVLLRKDQLRAARTIYERTAEQYPNLDGGLIAKMRLAEEGIYDEPTMLEMVSVFDRPFTLRPKQVYTEIVNEHPDSPLAPLALLKLGMWHFFQKEYPEALAAAQRLLDEYPRSELTGRARELGNRAFALAVPQLLEQKRYQDVVDYWERYPFIAESQGEESNATRTGVARAYAALDQYDKALALVKPFLGEKQVPEYSEMALAVAADVFLEQRAWNRINDLSNLVEENWDITPRARRLLMHANAVALENLGEHRKSARLWAQLGADEDVEPFIRADSLYFMAKEAMKHDDLRRVFVYAQEALSLLLSSDGDPEKIKDCMLMSIHATERSGRYRQALKWALEYDKYLAEDDPEWAAHRYKLAELYRRSGFPEEWRQTMEQLRDQRPESLYGRLAATAIETEQIQRQASEYAPIPN